MQVFNVNSLLVRNRLLIRYLRCFDALSLRVILFINGLIADKAVRLMVSFYGFNKVPCTIHEAE